MKNQIGCATHVHSEGSFLDGFSSVKSIAKRASDIGMKAVALTDHYEVNQHFALQRACDDYRIKPIFGMEGALVDSITRVREQKDRETSHYCVYAENNEGLRNLWALSSDAYINGMYYRALSDWEMISKYAKGLILTDG